MASASLWRATIQRRRSMLSAIWEGYSTNYWRRNGLTAMSDVIVSDNSLTLNYTIKILDHQDWSDDKWFQDMEVTLVHELNHIHTGLFCPTYDTDEEEHCVEFLARALVKLKREKEELKKAGKK